MNKPNGCKGLSLLSPPWNSRITSIDQHTEAAVPGWGSWEGTDSPLGKTQRTKHCDLGCSVLN